MGYQQSPKIKMDKQCKRKKNKKGTEISYRTNCQELELIQEKVEILKIHFKNILRNFLEY